MIILLFSFIGSFSWYPIIESDIYGNFNETIKNSSEISSIIRQYGGEEYLIKGFIHLDGDIFKGGEMVLLPKEYKIARIPANLQLLKRNIDMKKYNRFTALYRDGELKGEWNDLRRESEYQLGISSLENLTLDNAKELFPERIKNSDEELYELEMEASNLGESDVSEVEAKFPRKHYLSFISIEENWREMLIPVILHLTPVDEKIEELNNLDE